MGLDHNLPFEAELLGLVTAGDDVTGSVLDPVRYVLYWRTPLEGRLVYKGAPERAHTQLTSYTTTTPFLLFSPPALL